MTLPLAYREYGAGKPLLILHGLFGSGMNWRSIAKGLAARYRVVAPDLRDHGDSPHTDAMEYALLAQDVLALLASQRLTPAAVMGHSMGGKVAMVLALNHPHAVERLIVVDIAPVVYRHDYRGILDALSQLNLATLRDRREADQRLAESIADPRLRAFLLQNLRQGAHGWRWRINLRTIAADIRAIMAFPTVGATRPYRGKTLFIRGGRSPYIRPAYQRSIERLFPNARMHTIEDAGHWLHAERPQAFVKTVQQFLEE